MNQFHVSASWNRSIAVVSGFFFPHGSLPLVHMTEGKKKKMTIKIECCHKAALLIDLQRRAQRRARCGEMCQVENLKCIFSYNITLKEKIFHISSISHEGLSCETDLTFLYIKKCIFTAENKDWFCVLNVRKAVPLSPDSFCFLFISFCCDVLWNSRWNILSSCFSLLLLCAVCMFPFVPNMMTVFLVPLPHNTPLSFYQISNYIQFQPLIIFPLQWHRLPAEINKVSSNLNLMKLCQPQRGALAALFSADFRLSAILLLWY